MDGMPEVLDYLRAQFTRVHARLDQMATDIGEVKYRVTALESQVALLHADFAGQSGRIDRMEARLERIERRLDLA